MMGLLGAYAYDNANNVDAYEMVVEGEVWFVMSSQDEVTTLLNTYKAKYMGNVDPHATLVSVDFVQRVDVNPVRVSKETPVSIEVAQTKLSIIVTPATIYTVQPGDNLWNIAIENDIPLSEIIRLNPKLNPDKIWPEDEILFVPEDPLLDVKVRLENGAFEPVQYATTYIQDATLYASQRIVVKPGLEGTKRVTYDITLLNGYPEEVVVAQETELIAPVAAVVRVGTKRTLVRVSNSNFGVTTGRLSSNFGYRTHPITGVKTFHAGIDIATPSGTPVYAYADGTVSQAGYDNYYGKYVMINHGSGLVTVYMHLSSISMSVGDKVRVGQKVGGVGSTGYSTGSHLHFEVRINGSAKSPWSYI